MKRLFKILFKRIAIFGVKFDIHLIKADIHNLDMDMHCTTLSYDDFIKQNNELHDELENAEKKLTKLRRELEQLKVTDKNIGCVCYGVKIPNWCIGKSLNIHFSDISEKQQKKVRNWYLENLPSKCEVIKDRSSNWIGSEFGARYYSGSSEQWGGYRLYVGENIYVKLY